MHDQHWSMDLGITKIGNLQQWIALQKLLTMVAPGLALKRSIERGLWSFNTRLPYEDVQQARAFNIKDIAQRIKVPMWIADGTSEMFFRGQ